MRRTFKYRIYPTRNQERMLLGALSVCRTLYNSCILDRKNRYERTGASLSYNEQAAILKRDKERVEVLRGVHSQVLQDVLRRVDRAFAAFFRRVKAGEAPGYPRFKGMDRYDSITYPQATGFGFTANGLRLSRIGTVKIKLHRPILGTVKTCTIARDSDRWHACFSVEIEPVKRWVPNEPIGVDMGLLTFATLSNGEIVDNPRWFRKAEECLARRQRVLSRGVKGSSNRKRARLKVARAHRKVRDQRRDFHHKLSKRLVDHYNPIAVENLNIRGMVRNSRLSKSISDAGWGQFLNFLEYKAEEAGTRVEKVDPRRTSIACSVCGHLVPKTLAERTHECPNCGVSMDRDRNAAMNILNRAGTARMNARGDATPDSVIMANQVASAIREAPSARAG